MTNKISLAANNRISRTLMPIIPLTILTIIVYQLKTEEFTGTGVTILIIIYAVILILIYKGFNSYNIYYNQSSMLLEGRKETIVIPFSVIKHVKRTSNRLNYMGFILFQYNIEYIGPDKLLDEIHFWSYLGGEKAEKFIRLVKAKNQQLIIEQGSTP